MFVNDRKGREESIQKG